MLARGKDGDLDSWMPTDPSSLPLHFNTFKQYVCSMSTLSDAHFSGLKLKTGNAVPSGSINLWTCGHWKYQPVGSCNIHNFL